MLSRNQSYGDWVLFPKEEYLLLLVFKVVGKAELLCRHVAEGMFVSMIP